MDFTFHTYQRLLTCLKSDGYAFQTFAEFLRAPKEKVVILRHDVEKRIDNAVKLAEICHSLSLSATFFIRLFDGKVPVSHIEKITSLGHEVGYHYDDLSECRGDYEKAIQRFQTNLASLRNIVPVQSIVAEGAPLSTFDNKDLWTNSTVLAEGLPKPQHYRAYGIEGEPYFDVDFNQVFYLTDTGRRWDGYKVSVRDKIPEHQKRWEQDGLVFHSTNDIIRAVADKKLPSQLMITMHPQRWNDVGIRWTKELVLQNAKNLVKKVLIKRGAV